jgi:hypothetical protein
LPIGRHEPTLGRDEPRLPKLNRNVIEALVQWAAPNGIADHLFVIEDEKGEYRCLPGSIGRLQPFCQG